MIYQSLNVEVLSLDHPELLAVVLLPVSFFIARIVLDLSQLKINVTSAIDPFYLLTSIDPTLLAISDKIKNEIGIKQRVETFVTLDPRFIALSASNFYEGHVTLNKKLIKNFPYMIDGVIAHELAHIVFDSVIWKCFVEFLTLTTSAYLYLAFVIFITMYWYEYSIFISAFYLILSILTLLQIVRNRLNPIRFIANIFSRSIEYSCDGVATILGYGDDLTFHLNWLAKDSDMDLFDIISSTHPTEKNRVKYIRSFHQELD